jgi:hypothetical protein
MTHAADEAEHAPAPARSMNRQADAGRMLELRMPGEQFADIATEVLTAALDRGGVAEAIKQAAQATLALRGLLLKEQAATFLRIEVRTLELWMRPEAEGGKGVPHLKIDRTVRFRIEALEEWARKFEVNPVARRLAA